MSIWSQTINWFSKWKPFRCVKAKECVNYRIDSMICNNESPKFRSEFCGTYKHMERVVGSYGQECWEISDKDDCL